METLIISMGLVIGFLLLTCIWLIVKSGDQRRLVERQSFRIKYLEKPPSKRNRDHANAWNSLWDLIRNHFNIYKLENGIMHGGKEAEELKSLLRANFGVFNINQIKIITNIIVKLKQINNNQIEYNAALNPIGKDIIFTEEGGFKIIEPSIN